MPYPCQRTSKEKRRGWNININFQIGTTSVVGDSLIMKAPYIYLGVFYNSAFTVAAAS